MRPSRLNPLGAALILVLSAGTACYGGRGEMAATSRPVTNAAATDQAQLRGSGSTFVEPLLRAWIERYKTIAPGVSVDYTGDGSPPAIDRLKQGDGDFFASETPLTELDEAILGGSQEYLQVPWAAGAIAIAYNLPEVEGLRLRPDTLAAVFSGKVVRWDDPAIRADNEDARLPSQPIQVVYRADPSGTTSVFSSYLDAAAGASWGLGAGRSVIRFPRGQGVEGSSAVVDAVRRTTGTIGYVQLGYARREGVRVALVGNRAGQYLSPSPDAVSAALDTASLRSDSTVVRLNFGPDSPGAYPLATVSYLIFSRTALDAAKARALRHLATWAMTEGQRLAEPLGYTPVPRQWRVPALKAVDEPPG